MMFVKICSIRDATALGESTVTSGFVRSPETRVGIVMRVLPMIVLTIGVWSRAMRQFTEPIASGSRTLKGRKKPSTGSP